MKAKVSYFGHLRAKAGVKSEMAEVAPGQTVGDVLEVLLKERDVHSEVFGEAEGPKSPVSILLNGRNIRFLKGLDTPLSEGDQISIFPPTGGG